MRYALIILAFLFCTIKTDAQVYQAMPQAGYGPVKRMLIDSVLTIPIGISALRNITGGRDTAQIRYQKSDSSVYVYTGSTWVKLGTGAGGGGGSADSTVFFTVYRADTMRANIYASIVSTDSSVYFTKYRSDTMRANLYSYIKNADSLTYFTKYRSDTMRANIYAAIPQPDTFYVKYPVRVDNDTIYLAQTFVDSVGTGGGGGGGAGTINYYLNGSISQGTFGGTTYYQLSQNPIFGAGTNFTRTNGDGNGYIASFITDANDPNVLGIPGGNWNLEFYFHANSSGGSPQFYAEVYKYDGSTFTLLASGSTNPETITNATTVDQYFTSIPVPTATLLATDRIAVRVYVIPGGRTITLHTENSNLSEVLTTLTIPAWKTNGNSDVNAGRFLGSTNNASVRFRTNNVERMVLDSIGGLKMASVANNATLANALQLANTDNRSFFNISTSTSITNLTLKANNNAVLDSMVISDSGLIAPRTNASLWLKPTQTGNNNVVANRCAGCGSGSIFSANVGTNAPIFNMLSTGQMAINGETPASTAALDITSTSRGLLIPRMTTTQRNAISSPATGLMVWNTTDTTLNQYTGNRWRPLANTDGQTFTDSLVLTSTVGGISLPNMTQTQMNAIVPRLGTQVYNTTYDAVCTYTNDFGWWSNDQQWATSNGLMIFDDFVTYAYTNNTNGNFFQVQNSNGTWTTATPVNNRPGILQMSTGTNAAGRLTVQADGIGVADGTRSMVLGGGKLVFEADVQIPTLSSAAQTFHYFIGLSSTQTTIATNSVAFVYDSAGTNAGSSAIGRWQVVCAAGGSRSYTTTDTTVTAGRWYRLRAEVNAAGNSVQFFINGALVRTETNNIPTLSVTPLTSIIKTNGTTARTAWLDFIRIRQKFTTPR